MVCSRSLEPVSKRNLDEGRESSDMTCGVKKKSASRECQVTASSTQPEKQQVNRAGLASVVS
jgi:hypothetical protein